eukprot:Gregarina_sp_Poly_1__5494@NODE_28_length_19636_cov_263_287087_g25_i0_p9_GENE_NODE_28_length_19636_cov_263_287087_g25_i0NODE_28_length_19636_cov_263_287087_g25_i0_p9_ORF_typecomplete_len340_score33_29_NODE_28_length_19636_cov_263_287087_g25_i019432962
MIRRSIYSIRKQDIETVLPPPCLPLHYMQGSTFSAPQFTDLSICPLRELTPAAYARHRLPPGPSAALTRTVSLTPGFLQSLSLPLSRHPSTSETPPAYVALRRRRRLASDRRCKEPQLSASSVMSSISNQDSSCSDSNCSVRVHHRRLRQRHSVTHPCRHKRRSSVEGTSDASLRTSSATSSAMSDSDLAESGKAGSSKSSPVLHRRPASSSPDRRRNRKSLVRAMSNGRQKAQKKLTPSAPAFRGASKYTDTARVSRSVVEALARLVRGIVEEVASPGRTASSSLASTSTEESSVRTVSEPGGKSKCNGATNTEILAGSAEPAEAEQVMKPLVQLFAR